MTRTAAKGHSYVALFFYLSQLKILKCIILHYQIFDTTQAQLQMLGDAHASHFTQQTWTSHRDRQISASKAWTTKCIWSDCHFERLRKAIK